MSIILQSVRNNLKKVNSQCCVPFKQYINSLFKWDLKRTALCCFKQVHVYFHVQCSALVWTKTHVLMVSKQVSVIKLYTVGVTRFGARAKSTTNIH